MVWLCMPGESSSIPSEAWSNTERSEMYSQVVGTVTHGIAALTSANRAYICKCKPSWTVGPHIMSTQTSNSTLKHTTHAAQPARRTNMSTVHAAKDGEAHES